MHKKMHIKCNHHDGRYRFKSIVSMKILTLNGSETRENLKLQRKRKWWQRENSQISIRILKTNFHTMTKLNLLLPILVIYTPRSLF
jgi:hypothetical protein